METAVLKDYLSALIDRYKAIYTANQLQKHIKSQIDKLHGANEKTVRRPEPPVFVDNSESAGEIAASSIGGFFKGIGIGFGVWVAISILLTVVDFLTPGKLLSEVLLGVMFAICILPGIIYPFFRAISGTAAKSELREKAAKDFEHVQKNYANALANYEKKLKELPAKRELNNLAIANLKQETTRLDEIINGANNAIAELYDKGVVFEKYRYFVALASFYEYLMSGRCETLEGRDGAYNLYETELRQNIIIGKIEEIVDRLNEIRDTQYVMCAAIQESNRISREIASELSDIRGSVSDIKFNSAAAAKSSKLTEFYAAESARNSKILVDLNRGDFDTLVTKGGRHIIG